MATFFGGLIGMIAGATCGFIWRNKEPNASEASLGVSFYFGGFFGCALGSGIGFGADVSAISRLFGKGKGSKSKLSTFFPTRQVISQSKIQYEIRQQNRSRR